MRAAQLVRNGVTHDARVQRAVGVLDDLGYAVTIVGAVTAQSPAARETIGPATVVRLRARSPLGLLTRLFGRVPRVLARPHRLLTTIAWNLRAVRELRRLRPSLIHANDYNTVWPALIARRLWGGRVVYDSHELWADRNGRPEWRAWLVFWERRFVRWADVVITASPGYSAELAGRYGVPEPPVVRNIPAQAPPPSTTEPDPDLAVYVGGLMPGRGLEPMIDALAAVPALRLRLVGRGNAAYEQRLHDRAAAVGVSDRLELTGEVPAADVPAAAAGAAFGVCLIEPVCRSYELTLPNKLFEYAAAGVPVLGSSTTPVIAAVVSQAGIGANADPADVHSLVDAITEIRADVSFHQRVAQFAIDNAWPTDAAVLASAYT